MLQFVEHVEKANRVRAARDGHDDEVSRLEHLVAGEGGFDLVQGLAW
jgi:hypothetical protein